MYDHWCIATVNVTYMCIYAGLLRKPKPVLQVSKSYNMSTQKLLYSTGDGSNVMTNNWSIHVKDQRINRQLPKCRQVAIRRININITHRYWKLLASLHKRKCSTAINRFVPIIGLKLSSLDIHELTAIDRYNLNSFPSPLTLDRHQWACVSSKDWILDRFW